MSRLRVDNGQAWEAAFLETARLKGVPATHNDRAVEITASLAAQSPAETQALLSAAGYSWQRIEEQEGTPSCIEAVAQTSHDTSDLLMHYTRSRIVGISCKRNNEDLRGMRISMRSHTFFDTWSNHAPSHTYLTSINGVLNEIAKFKGRKFSSIPDKSSRFYAPMRDAVLSEFSKLDANSIREFVEHVFGSRDYYLCSVTGVDSGVLGYSVRGINLRGGLRCARLKLPTRLYQAIPNGSSCNRIILVFDGGWQMCVRFKNGDSKINTTNPGLKLSLTLVGAGPSGMFVHNTPVT